MPVRSLASAARSSFSASSRHRGESYFWSRRVTNPAVEGNTFRARVIGTRVYDVELRLEDQRLSIECTCPQFVDHVSPCKHIWAAILAADERQALTAPAGMWVDWFGALDTDDRAERGRRSAALDGSREVRHAVRHEPPPEWQVFLSHLTAPASRTPPPALLAGELIYVLDVSRSIASRALIVELMTRQRKKNGEWAKPKPISIARHDVAYLPDPGDRRILEILAGGSPHSYGTSWNYAAGLPIAPSYALNLTLQREIVPQLCETARFFLRDGVEQLNPIAWDATAAEFVVRIGGSADSGYSVTGLVRSGGRERPLSEARFLTGALILWPPLGPGEPARLAQFDPRGAERWLGLLATTGAVAIPPSETGALAEALAVSGVQCEGCPDELRITQAQERPHPVVRISRAPSHGYRAQGRLNVALTFGYGTREVEPWSTEAAVVDGERRTAWRRDVDAERAALARLQQLGVRRVTDWRSPRPRLECTERLLPKVVRSLLPEGWSVEAEGRLYRRATAFALDVRSGVDWFELHGSADFDGISVPLPALLAAARRKDGFVALGDGTFGLLPEEWLARSGRIAAIGTPEADHVRFAASQAALLDAWLSTETTVHVDEAFAGARAALASFDRITPLDAPPTFHGELRDYQRDALGWFEFLRRFGFGGCLADEMGLGKTVMVLAALEARRLERQTAGGAGVPSLIVVPRSLVFNWHQEAARFAPELRVLDYTGGGRRDSLPAFTDYDVVLTTYGTMKRDAGHLKDVTFDYVILDEAQAIKNAQTNAAKAARLLKGRHRLALSGTPIENHLGELWSLFEFLNPGILGSSSVFTATGTSADPETLAVLATGVRPFILRRTKEQVASELPPRTEQTLYCDLEPPQRRFYDDLRDHYRASLLGVIERTGLGRAKLQILEALLRLRQAACHPGLVDREQAEEASAKLDVLVDRLQELVEDGRKALVFSQFTSFLALLRPRLEEQKIAYEYLDGRTRDRAARVARFQEGDSPLFLISLKAGGLGLNLTAADYVFLLDPWWNPAVEAQAIDRTHRIGQTRPVFAFRLIARDTVEEKVLELQASKRRLADAIIRADASLIRDLRREDLELLLS